jgi:hypothetical protein
MTKDLMMNGRCPPHRLINRAAQTSALKSCGHEVTPEVIKQYIYVVRRMSKIERAQIFFLKANDDYFKPNSCRLGQKIITTLKNCQSHKDGAFLDVKL